MVSLEIGNIHHLNLRLNWIISKFVYDYLHSISDSRRRINAIQATDNATTFWNLVTPPPLASISKQPMELEFPRAKRQLQQYYDNIWKIVTQFRCYSKHFFIVCFIVRWEMLSCSRIYVQLFVILRLACNTTIRQPQATSILAIHNCKIYRHSYELFFFFLPQKKQQSHRAAQVQITVAIC